MEYNLHSLEVALKYLLQEKYFGEFESIDGYNRHPEFINFYEWLYRRHLITQVENDRIQAAIKAESSEDF
jgi:hypothetical protein